mmetsp:Transcript_163559/g.524427  ORF Transcript_163559/g.524427 Transcript_163559/m.524427 type:complete len:280 (+) Transcript_163559:118-957(+)
MGPESVDGPEVRIRTRDYVPRQVGRLDAGDGGARRWGAGSGLAGHEARLLGGRRHCAHRHGCSSRPSRRPHSGCARDPAGPLRPLANPQIRAGVPGALGSYGLPPSGLRPRQRSLRDGASVGLAVRGCCRLCARRAHRRDRGRGRWRHSVPSLRHAHPHARWRSGDVRQHGLGPRWCLQPQCAALCWSAGIRRARAEDTSSEVVLPISRGSEFASHARYDLRPGLKGPVQALLDGARQWLVRGSGHGGPDREPSGQHLKHGGLGAFDRARVGAGRQRTP